MMISKRNIGHVLSSTLIALLLFITIRLTGHKHSLGVLGIGLAIANFIVLVLISAGWQFKILNTKSFLFYTIIAIAVFGGFILYHQTYDSYNETRSILWGLNGE